MARRKRGGGGGGGGGGEWLNTYADMVTLLLTFFILLFSMSSLDAAKFNMLVKVFANESESSETIVIYGEGQYDGISGTNKTDDEPTDDLEIADVDLEEVFRQIQEYIQENNMQESVQASMGDDYIFIRFMDNMLFEANSARLKAEDLEILNFVGHGIKSVQNSLKLVRIDGHTAAIPENPNYPVSDRDLSSERANRVLRYFEDDLGIRSELLIQMAFGKNVPIADNSDPSERSKNRRVEIFISTENEITDQLNNVYEKLVE